MIVSGVQETRPQYMNIIDADGNYSLFNVKNKVNLTINDVIITNAVISRTPSVETDNLAVNASVFDITNADANVKLSNVILRNNKDNVIYNLLGNVELKNVTVENTDEGFGDSDNVIENRGGTIVTLGTNVFGTSIKNMNESNSSEINSNIIFAGNNTVNGTILNDKKGKIYVGTITAGYTYAGDDTVVLFNNDVQNAGEIIVDANAQFNSKLTSLNDNYGSLSIKGGGIATVAANGEIEKDNSINIDNGGQLVINQGKATLDSLTDTVSGTIVLGKDNPTSGDTSELRFKGVNYDSLKYVFTGKSGNLYIEENL